MSKRVNGKKGNRVRRRNPFQYRKVRGTDIDTLQSKWAAQIHRKTGTKEQEKDVGVEQLEKLQNFRRRSYV